MTASGYRPLTKRERDLIIWLLEHSSVEAEEYIPQLASVQVRSSCACGCPSIGFSLPLNESVAMVPAKIIADFKGAVDGLGVGLILFASEGVLKELEVYPFEDTKKPFGLPSLETLKSIS
jgi:hypothetical protein